MASVLEQLMSTLSPEEQAIVKAKMDPKLVALDKKNEELFGYWTGIDAAATTTETPETTVTPAATHTPTVPSAATTTAAPAATTTSAAGNDFKTVLESLNGLKTSLDEKMKNVITKDQLPTLGAELVNNAISQALKQSNELAIIRETYREEFGKPLDSAAFEAFVLAGQDATTKRNKYPTLTAAFDAMVNEDRIKARVTKEVDEQVKQKTSGATVPGVTVNAALSPAQQVMAKSKKDAAAGGGTGLQSLIQRAEALEKARESSAAVN